MTFIWIFSGVPFLHLLSSSHICLTHFSQLFSNILHHCILEVAHEIITYLYLFFLFYQVWYPTNLLFNSNKFYPFSFVMFFSFLLLYILKFLKYKLYIFKVYMITTVMLINISNSFMYLHFCACVTTSEIYFLSKFPVFSPLFLMVVTMLYISSILSILTHPTLLRLCVQSPF